MDAVSSFLCSLHRSLNLGTIRGCHLNVEFRVDVYNNYLLKEDKGTKPHSGCGLLFNLEDFDSTFFCDNWFVSYDKIGNGCAIDFPIRLQAVLKQGPVRYMKTSSRLVRQPRVYVENLIVTVVKRRC